MNAFRSRLGWLLTNIAEPQGESPRAARRRQFVVVAGLNAGAILLAVSLTRRPGDASFYWLTFALAAVWAGAAVASG
ncbi:MAG TPA: hypothetical protein PKI77_06155, partial [Mycobacterium sp.]|nr:hypothetical protein [Mycobacterium sp.]